MENTENYIFNKEYLNSLMSNYFNLNPSINSWDKDKIDSIRLLSDVFNSYVDVAQETFNFTQLENIQEENEKKLNQSIIKNLLFIFRIMNNYNLNTQALFESLKEAYPRNSYTHPTLEIEAEPRENT